MPTSILGLPQAPWWPLHDCEQWLRTESVACKIRCCGILGPVVTRLKGRFISSQSGPPWPTPSSANEVSKDIADPCPQMGDVRPNQTTHSPLPAAFQAAPSPDTPGRGCSQRNCLFCSGRRGGQKPRPWGRQEGATEGAELSVSHPRLLPVPEAWG